MMVAERVNIASHLSEMARLHPDADALLTGGKRSGAGGKRIYRHTSLKELDERSTDLARGFENAGITAGTRVALCVKPGVDFFAVTFGLFKLGAVPVLIDPGIGMKNFGRCLDQAKPSAFIGIPIAHAARRLLGWAKKTNRLNITTGWFGGISLERLREKQAVTIQHSAFRIQHSSQAAILFTSGSTGPAKGVVYTHANFEAQIAALKATYGIAPGELDMATFPLFALFGPALGMAAVIPTMDFTRPGFVDPVEIIEPIQQLGITNMFGSPALVDRVGRYGEKHGVKLPSLKRVISAGAPASAPVLARFAKMLSPGVEIFTPYGATEALPVSSMGSVEILGETAALTESPIGGGTILFGRGTAGMTDVGKGVCVGRAAENIRVRIIRITDDPIDAWNADLELATNEIGEIVVEGAVVTREYFERPDATGLAKITASGTEFGFYHRMGDVGYFDERGRLWFCGRKSQRVRLEKGDLYSTPVEGIFNTDAAVKRTALVGVRLNGKMEPVVCVELLGERAEQPEAVKQGLRKLAEKFEHTRGIQEFLFHRGFPVDIRHNAKINREQLTLWAQRKLG